jgi:hypothetical protein
MDERRHIVEIYGTPTTGGGPHTIMVGPMTAMNAEHYSKIAGASGWQVIGVYQIVPLHDAILMLAKTEGE